MTGVQTCALPIYLEEWFAAGVVGVGVGGELTKDALAKKDFSLATEAARRFVAKVKECKSKYADK